jgi:hypothetical protein
VNGETGKVIQTFTNPEGGEFSDLALSGNDGADMLAFDEKGGLWAVSRDKIIQFAFTANK